MCFSATVVSVFFMSFITGCLQDLVIFFSCKEIIQKFLSCNNIFLSSYKKKLSFESYKCKHYDLTKPYFSKVQFCRHPVWFRFFLGTFANWVEIFQLGKAFYMGITCCVCLKTVLRNYTSQACFYKFIRIELFINV